MTLWESGGQLITKVIELLRVRKCDHMKSHGSWHLEKLQIRSTHIYTYAQILTYKRTFTSLMTNMPWVHWEHYNLLIREIYTIWRRQQEKK